MLDNITVPQFWGLLLSAIAVFKTFEYLINRFIFPIYKKNQEQEETRKMMEEIKTKLDNDFKILSDHEGRLGKIETEIDKSKIERSDMHEALRIIIYGQQQMTKSLLEDGNNRDGLEDAEKRIEEYLRKKI